MNYKLLFVAFCALAASTYADLACDAPGTALYAYCKIRYAECVVNSDFEESYPGEEGTPVENRSICHCSIDVTYCYTDAFCNGTQARDYMRICNGPSNCRGCPFAAASTVAPLALVAVLALLALFL